MRRIALGLAAVAVGIAGCGSSSTKTVTVHAATPTAASTGSAATATIISTQTTSSAPATLPTLTTKGWSGVKPTLVDFSGDAGNVVTGIKWKYWDADGAAGFGASGIQNCIPNCAQGQTKMVPTTLVLAAPRGGHFTQIVETRNGSTLIADYKTRNWPIGAQ